MPVFKDAVCSFCGSLCYDITVTVENNRITKIQNACALGHSKFVGMFEHGRIETPMVRKEGELVTVSYEEAIEAAAKILVKSRRILSTAGAQPPVKRSAEPFSLQKRRARSSILRQMYATGQPPLLPRKKGLLQLLLER